MILFAKFICLKLAQLKIFNVFSFCDYHLPFEKCMTFNLKKKIRIPFTQEYFVHSYVEISGSGEEYLKKNRQYI